MDNPTFTIITPCLNAENTIGETIRSVISQEGQFRIQYIIVDGGSTDNTREIISTFCDSIQFQNFSCPNLGVTISPVFESDEGMYDALKKGFLRARGDITAYLNADDFYLPGALHRVKKVFAKHSDVQWLSGIISVYNSDGDINFTFNPYIYKRHYVLKGLYSGKVFPFIPQENIFWRSSLTGKINMSLLGTYKYAGDYFLWCEFSKHTQLFFLPVSLAGFRKYPNQKSLEKNKYIKELQSIASEKVLWIDVIGILFHKIMWYLPAVIKNKFHPYIITDE